MIGLDTNVLVRYLAQDDLKQAATAARLIDEELTVSRPGFISLVVLAEMCWVLSRLYGATQQELASTAEEILNMAQFHVEHREVVQTAIGLVQGGKRSSTGFVDVLIANIAISRGCSRVVSFDKVAVRNAGMTLLI